MNKVYLKNITAASVFLVGMLLPLSTAFSNIGLGIFLAATLYSFYAYGIEKKVLKNYRTYLFTPLLFFLIVLAGSWYSPMDYEVFKEIKRTLFMLAIPTILLRKDIVYSELIKQAAVGLLFGALLSAILLLTINGINLFQEGLSWNTVFNYHHTSFNFTKPLGIHPIYLGSYYLMALIFVLNQTIPLKKSLFIPGITVLIIGIIFLNSRIIMGLTGMIALFFLFKNLSWKAVLLVLAGGMIGLFLLYPKIKNTYLGDKLISGTQWELSDNVGTYNTDNKYPADSRFSRWKIAWELIKEQPLLGYGTGTERDVLAEQFKINQMKVSYESRYNAHNQFIGFTLRYGIIGLGLVLLFFIKNIQIAVYSRDYAFLCFLFIIIGVCLVENYLDRNMGLNFMAFFGTFFVGKHLYRN